MGPEIGKPEGVLPGFHARSFFALGPRVFLFAGVSAAWQIWDQQNNQKDSCFLARGAPAGSPFGNPPAVAPQAFVGALAKHRQDLRVGIKGSFSLRWPVTRVNRP